MNTDKRAEYQRRARHRRLIIAGLTVLVATFIGIEIALQQSIGGLLERELQKQMLARGNKEFAFKIIDPAQPPKVRSRPQRKIIVVFATFVGGVLAVLAVLLHHSIVSTRTSMAVTNPQGFPRQ